MDENIKNKLTYHATVTMIAFTIGMLVLMFGHSLYYALGFPR